MPRKRSAFGRKPNKFKLKKSTLYSLSSVLLIILALLIWISFSHQGLILFRINNLLLELFGLFPALILPLPIIAAGLLVSKIKSQLSQPHVFLGSTVFFIAVTGLFRGGLAGQSLWLGSSTLLSAVGAFLALSAGAILGLVIALNVPFEDVVLFFSHIVRAVWRFFFPPKTASLLDKSSLTSVRKPSFATPQGPLPSPPARTPVSSSPSSLLTAVPAAANAPWHYPPLSLLSENISGKADRGNVNGNAATIENTLEAFGITAKVVEVNLGPAVTQYALEVAIGTKLSKISALGSDLALALAAPTGQIRIEAPIPGRSLVGIELPNRAPEFVSLRKVLESDTMHNHKSKLAVALGLDVSGQPVISDLGKMPHALIAGATGSGKSVCINAFIASLLFRCSPQELSLILVDPKRVELTGYNGIPHLLTPVIVEPDKVLSALKWSMSEMDRRYKLFAEVGVRNLEAYNELSGFQALPYIVIFVDELADIMLYAPVEVEDAITRIAQMARATGIHLIISTQRPSVDIITGLIKANIPSRIAFAVSSMIDSRVIIDQPGAEKLLGRGDMLYVPPDQAKPTRIQGCFVSDREIHQLIDFLKKQGVTPHYTEEVTSQAVNVRSRGYSRGSNLPVSAGGERDPLFTDAFRLIAQHKQASASFLQRKLSIGYARAARILDELYQAGIIGAGEGAKPRDILITDVEGFLSSPAS